jgi:hypothetical protein
MQVEAGKAGCAFEIVLDNDDGDFVVVDKDGNPTQGMRREIPERLRNNEGRSKHTLLDVVSKLRHAEARRDAQNERIRSKACAANMKVKAAQSAKDKEVCDFYWTLDNKLRSADRRRAELVQRIREKAQLTSARAVMAGRSVATRRHTLEDRINNSLVRAAENRNSIIRDLRARLQKHSSHIERVRAEYNSTNGSRMVDEYWNHDRKITDADKRRQQIMNTIRQKAGSPNAKIQAIKEHQKVDSEVRTHRIEERLTSAECRRRENHNQIKAKSQERAKKVLEIHELNSQRMMNRGSTSFERHQRAIENRQKYLYSVMSRQRQHTIKSERVRQTKRLMVASH